MNLIDLDVVRVHVMQPAVRSIVRNFALYLLNLPDDPPLPPNQANYSTPTQKGWAREVAKNPDQITLQVSQYAMNLEQFQTDGSSVDEAVLKGHLENAMRVNFFPDEPTPTP